MLLAAIVVIAAMLSPSVASAHPGHHGPAVAAVDAARQVTATEVADIVAAAGDHDPAPAFLSAGADDTAPDAGRACPAPCCCPSGGMSCVSPALGSAPASPVEPAVARVESGLASSSHLSDALRARLRKPPRA